MHRSLALLTSLALLGACTPDYDPPSLVNKLRVLGIRAEPPFVGLAGEVTFTTLAVGEQAEQKLCYAWAFCPFALAKDGNFQCITAGLQVDMGTDPTPTLAAAQWFALFADQDQFQAELKKAGLDFSAVAKPSSTNDKCNVTSATAAPGGMAIGNLEAYVLFQIAEAGLYGGTCPKSATATLKSPCADRSRCVAGYKQIAINTDNPSICKDFDSTIDKCTATPAGCPAKAVCGCDGKTYADDCARVAAQTGRLGNGACANHNPRIQGLRLDGIDWPEDATPVVAESDTIALTPLWPAGDKEYLGVYADPTLGSRFEDLLFSWFSTAGTFSRERSADNAPQSDWQVPALAAGKTERIATLWVVLRDGRAGTHWTTRQVRVQARAAAWPSAGGKFVDPVTHAVVNRPNALCVLDPKLPGCGAVDKGGKAHPPAPKP